MKHYFLDTSIIIDYLRGKNSAVELINGLDGDLNSSYICLAELYEGVYRVRNQPHLQEVIETFFSSLSFIYSIDLQIAHEFGKLRAELKTKGNVLEDIDILIAATCLINDLILVTYNLKHFQKVKGLKLFMR